MTAELTGSGPADSLGGAGLTDAQWRDLKDFEDSQRTYPALEDHGQAGAIQGGEDTLDEAPVACDNASVGVVIRDPGSDRWLMFERGRFPAGVAPVAGHVWDEHAAADAVPEDAYRAAARAEVAEELGLTVVDLIDAGVGGWRPNRCRRPGGRRGVGHHWRIYQATVTGDLAPSPDEARHPQWLSRGQLQQLADLTIAYAAGLVSDEDWTARPGIEPVWVDWLAQLGLIQAGLSDLVLVDQLAAGEPVQRVVFGEEIGEGTTVLEPCTGRPCFAEASRHSADARGSAPVPGFHELTLQRLRQAGGRITAVVTDQDGVQQPWSASVTTPVRVVASTLPARPSDAVAVPDPGAQQGPEWTGIPADPRWDPYRLRMAGPRWWRPWWTAHMDYLGAWTTHGDQTIIRARSWRRTKSLYEAIDGLVDHCRWLTDGPHADAGLIPVVWLGAHLVPVAHLAGAKAEEE
jgi:hypothetical protein